MKKEFKIVAVVLAMILVFLGGVITGTTKGGLVTIQTAADAGSADATTQTPATSAPTTATPTTAAPTTATPTTAVPTTAAPTTAAPQGGSTTTAAPTTAAPQGDATTAAPQGGSSAVPSTTEEVCAAYNKAINEYRAFKGTVTLHKVENTVVNITELPSVAKPLEGTINSVISNVVKPVDETFTFTNGADVNDPGRTIGKKIIPWDRDAKVTAADVSSATAAANPDGGYTITLKFVSETSSFDGTNTTDPVHHMTAMDPLNLATLSLDPIKISNAEMSYSGATTKLTVDAQGRLIKLENNLPLEGKGTGGMGPIKATIGLAGHMDSVYTLQYQ